MKKDDLIRTVDKELWHIPRGLRGSPQNNLRAAYNMVRRHDLGRNSSTPSVESLLKAIQQVTGDNPDIRLDYDKAFFRVLTAQGRFP